jgi:hypothetical protein
MVVESTAMSAQYSLTGVERQHGRNTLSRYGEEVVRRRRREQSRDGVDRRRSPDINMTSPICLPLSFFSLHILSSTPYALSSVRLLHSSRLGCAPLSFSVPSIPNRHGRKTQTSSASRILCQKTSLRSSPTPACKKKCVNPWLPASSPTGTRSTPVAYEN